MIEWWTQWGVETPELTRLAKKIVPLIVGSGAAERAWKDVANVLTKDRNKLNSDTTVDLVFVRTWLRREMQPVANAATECFKEWEVQLLIQVNEYLSVDADDAPAAAAAAADPRRIFEDRFEDWEQDAIDGTGSDPKWVRVRV